MCSGQLFAILRCFITTFNVDICWRYASFTAFHCNEVPKAWTFQKDNFGCKKATHLGDELQLRLKLPIGNPISHTAYWCSFYTTFPIMN
jgi:hypothetical protein